MIKNYPKIVRLMREGHRMVGFNQSVGQMYWLGEDNQTIEAACALGCVAVALGGKPDLALADENKMRDLIDADFRQEIIRWNDDFGLSIPEICNKIKQIGSRITAVSALGNTRDVHIRVGRYENTGNAAITLEMSGGEAYATVSVNPEHKLPDGYIALKGWSENAGLPEQLVAAGIVGPVEYTIPMGFATATVHKLLMEE